MKSSIEKLLELKKYIISSRFLAPCPLNSFQYETNQVQEIFQEKNNNESEGIKPSAIGIGSPGSLTIRKVSVSEIKDPSKIRSRDTIPVKKPKITKAFDTTIE